MAWRRLRVGPGRWLPMARCTRPCWLLTGALASLAIGSVAGCDPAPTLTPPSLAGSSGVWTKHTVGLVTLSVPSSWHVGDAWLSPSSFTYLVGSFSNQPLSSPCSTGPHAVTCGLPLGSLQVGGMLVQVYRNGFPRWTLDGEPGTPTMVSGLAARVAVQRGDGDACAGLNGDTARTEFIALPAADNYVEIALCSRGADTGPNSAGSRIMASVQVSPGG